MHWLGWALLASLSGVVYQGASKVLSTQISPFLYAFTIGGLITLVSGSILAVQWGQGHPVSLPAGSMKWLLLGALAGATIDIVVFMMFRAGAPLSLARTLTGALTACAVLVVGWLFFKEQISWQQVAGVVLCIGGISLISLGKIGG